MEFENMENLMKGDSNLVEIRRCPLCRKPIINTHRYKDLVNNLIAKEINPIKEKVYGNMKDIIARRAEFVEALEVFRNTHLDISLTGTTKEDWRKAFEKMLVVLKSKKKYSLLQLEMYFVYLNVMELISDIHKKFKGAALTELREHLDEQTSTICRVLVKNVYKISQQQQEDIRKELNRMNAIVNLSKIMSHQSYRTNKTAPKVIETFNAAKKIILGWGIFQSDSSLQALSDFQKAINVSGVVTREERQMIIKAIGATAGQWYKCPNGHFYSIDRCGGAMEEGRCNECNAQIGGTNHRLLSSNRHAGEFDNSRYAAYSEEANNMANFDLNNLL